MFRPAERRQIRTGAHSAGYDGGRPARDDGDVAWLHPVCRRFRCRHADESPRRRTRFPGGLPPSRRSTQTHPSAGIGSNRKINCATPGSLRSSPASLPRSLKATQPTGAASLWRGCRQAPRWPWCLARPTRNCSPLLAPVPVCRTSAHDIPSALAAMKGGRSGMAGVKGMLGAAGAHRRVALQAVPLIVFHGDRDHTVQQINGGLIVRQAREAYAVQAGGADLQ